MVDGLAGDAGRGVEVVVAKCVGVGVGDPGHLSLARPHVRGGDVDAGAEEGLLRQLDGETTGDALQLGVAVFLMGKIQ